ncbi:hypothetical protein H9P43_001245 [Blastocladiella emersonii ATCC 22665]|nr:hypothetical protein H9P43_001245 [Blastocladiella emersonii ATCC 22665]
MSNNHTSLGFMATAFAGAVLASAATAGVAAALVLKLSHGRKTRRSRRGGRRRAAPVAAASGHASGAEDWTDAVKADDDSSSSDEENEDSDAESVISEEYDFKYMRDADGTSQSNGASYAEDQPNRYDYDAEDAGEDLDSDQERDERKKFVAKRKAFDASRATGDDAAPASPTFPTSPVSPVSPDAAKSDAEHESDDEDDEEENKSKVLRFRVLDEVWNENKYSWVVLRKRKSYDEKAYAFVVHRRLVASGSTGLHKTMLRILSHPLVKVLQQTLPPHDRLYEAVPFVPVNHVYAGRKELKKWLNDYEAKRAAGKLESNDDEDKEEETSTAVAEADATKPSGQPDATAVLSKLSELSPEELSESAYAVHLLLDFLTEEYRDTVAKYDALMRDGLITYDLLWLLFNVNDMVVFDHPALKTQQGMRVTGTRYVPADLENPGYFSIAGDTIEWGETHFFTHNTRRGIVEFAGPRRVTELSVRPVDTLVDAHRAALVKRGKRYAELAGVHYVDYNGPIVFRNGCRIMLIPSRGRAMVDRAGFVQQNPGQQVNSPDTYTAQQEGLDTMAKKGGANVENVGDYKDDDFLVMPPTVYGFSLGKKAWGELLVDNVSEIQFDDTVYDQLVLAPRTKAMIRGLVESHIEGGLVGDVIKGKGQGLVFLLCGKPGLGKTLSAEAIAEQLRRPLYSVGVGELGVTPTELEANLQAALDVAESWNAVLLLDEADVICQQRNSSDLLRNAMVAIFLRLLEYYSGIMMLTTNRVSEFDQAFHSRISLSLRYPDLDEVARRTIWTQVLDRMHHGKDGTESAWSERIDLDSLVPLPLNGRRIKGILRTAQALALHDRVPLQQHHILSVIATVKSFAEDMDDEMSHVNVDGSLTRAVDPIMDVHGRDH